MNISKINLFVIEMEYEYTFLKNSQTKLTLDNWSL